MGIRCEALAEDGPWVLAAEEDQEHVYYRTNFDSLMRDPDEIFRFIWDNRFQLNLEARDDEEFSGGGYTRMRSVRPSVRIGPDGFTLRETVAEYIQTATLRYRELEDLGMMQEVSVEIPDETRDPALCGAR